MEENKTTMPVILSQLQIRPQQEPEKELTPMQVALRNGSTASQLVDEWSGTRAQLQCNYTLRDVAGQKGIPSVADVSRAFGNMTAVQIIVEHLKSIFSYAGMELSSEQLCETAMSIMTNYYYLNLAELCLFFVQLKAGARGQVGGALRFLQGPEGCHCTQGDRRTDAAPTAWIHQDRQCSCSHRQGS